MSFFLAVWIRFGTFSDALFSRSALITSAAVFIPLCSAVFLWQKLYRGVWRYVSLRDLNMIIRTVTIAVFLYVSVMFLLTVWKIFRVLFRFFCGLF